ncbi:hypothetical protein [Flavobacterium sp.]|uniref:hypothetical protein n=1 Tax=Flavobacterium sp. TaxID=239 RepID=UPI000EE90A91|nr:hypothetical protein [Flavobacterium sp.]HCQ14180.1 hypothetical protein [Flavobacterium sp.]
MENNDLGSKKMNNKQSNSNIISESNKENNPDSLMKAEMETDKNGVIKIVQRARNTDHDEQNCEPETNKILSTKPSTAKEEVGKVMLENRDKNFDITKKRYANSSPENQDDPKEKN